MYAWLDEALSADGSYVITANRRLARELRRVYGQRQAEAGRIAWPTPNIQFLNDWMSAIADALPPTEQVPVRINSQHSRILWESVLEEDIDDPLTGIGGLARQCRDTWARMCEWNVPLSECQSAATGSDQVSFRVRVSNRRQPAATGGDRKKHQFEPRSVE